MGEGDTEEAAIDAAVTEYEQAIGYGDEPHLYPDREALVASLDVSVAAQVRWQDLQLLDVDGATPLNVDAATRHRLLGEYRRTGGMSGAFFAPLGWPHEDPDDASTWGPPSPDHVDWGGFD